MEDFLSKNNLNHLAAVFEEQKISEIELLNVLTDEEIGRLVNGSIGDKIRLKRGIANLLGPKGEVSESSIFAEDSENEIPSRKVQILENITL